jgi:TM2 domain-containing membrane protein YozV
MPGTHPAEHTRPTHPNPGIAYLLWLLGFVLVCGIHRFYTGRWVTGLVWILTLGVLYIGQIIDLFLIPGQCRNPKW